MRSKTLVTRSRLLLGLATGCGALLAATPRWLFPVCEAQVRTAAGGFIPMRCAWSANTLVALGILAAGVGVLGVTSRCGSSIRVSAFSLSGVFAVALLVPTKLIGVCGAPTHPCRAGTLPAVLAEAGVGLGLSIVAGILASVAATITDRDGSSA